jgi:hypothetical protein
MTATGESYAAARRQDISEYKADQLTAPVSAEDIRAAAEAHRELGRDYSDAVVASFIESVDRAVAARVEARLAERGKRPLRRRLARDVLAASAGALVAVGGVVGLHDIASAHPAPPASRLALGACASRVAYIGPAGSVTVLPKGSLCWVSQALALKQFRALYEFGFVPSRNWQVKPGPLGPR